MTVVIKPGVSNETLDISSRVVITKQAILNCDSFGHVCDDTAK